jgi:hypothetical protein
MKREQNFHCPFANKNGCICSGSLLCLHLLTSQRKTLLLPFPSNLTQPRLPLLGSATQQSAKGSEWTDWDELVIHEILGRERQAIDHGFGLGHVFASENQYNSLSVSP